MSREWVVHLISQGDEAISMSDLIDAHVRHLRAQSASPRTIHDRVRLLKALHTWLPFGLAYASTDELEDYIQSNPAWSDWTRRTYANHIRAFYLWANGRWLEGDPAANMARPRTPDSVPRPVTEDELAHALAHANGSWLTAIVLGAFAGLRISEAAGVSREDVTEQTILVRRAKGGNPAVVDTHPEVWKLVRDRPPGRLIRASATSLMSRERQYFNSIGLPGVTFHRFRHRFATALLNGGADLRTVQEAMRHRSIISTQGYTLVSGGQRRLAIRSLPTPARPPSEDQAP